MACAPHLPEALRWLEAATPAHCPKGHVMEWTDEAQPHAVVPGDVVHFDKVNGRAVMVQEGLWHGWMEGLVAGTMGEGRVSAVLPPLGGRRRVEVGFRCSWGIMPALFVDPVLLRQPRPGDAAVADSSRSPVLEGTVGYICAEGKEAEMICDGVVHTVRLHTDVTVVPQRWRCSKATCTGGHAFSGPWHWACRVCGCNLCPICAHAPPLPVRRALSFLGAPRSPPADGVLRASAQHMKPGVGDWVQVLARMAIPGAGNLRPLVDVGVVTAVREGPKNGKGGEAAECTVQFGSMGAPVQVRRDELRPLRPGQRVTLSSSSPTRPIGALVHISPDGTAAVAWAESRMQTSLTNIAHLEVVWLAVGDAVAVAHNDPAYGMGDVARSDIGVVIQVERGVVTVDFAVQEGWRGTLPDLCRLCPGALVKLCDPEVGTGTAGGADVQTGEWRQGVTQHDIGAVVEVYADGGCIVDFPSNAVWRGHVFVLSHVDSPPPMAATPDAPAGPVLPLSTAFSDAVLHSLPLLAGLPPAARRERFDGTRHRLQRVYAEWTAQPTAVRTTYNNLYAAVILGVCSGTPLL
eukprot:TRINITY_DN8310_c0_g1_i2.p1 TRINITY_DN8310_c0_g1~~TRINITY_DN8310_c0_g1_i2.p1  ORF type:complete len:603 (+),score=55.89 TRINITY_DN8310_c0_g1_i2:85-1809(+)